MASRVGWLYFGEHDKACTSQPPFLCSCMIFGIQTANPLWCVTTDATETWGIWRTPESWFKWQTSGVQMVCSATNMWIWLVIANTWFVEDSQVFPQWEMRNLSWIHREYVLFFLCSLSKSKKIPDLSFSPLTNGFFVQAETKFYRGEVWPTKLVATWFTTHNFGSE